MSELRERLGEELSDRYEIGRVIGHGGMATVFLAREFQPDRQVAIKVLDPDVSSFITRARFLREVDLAGRLVHPHIVPVFAAGEVQDLLYCVMPFIEGDSLRHQITTRRSLPLREALTIAAEAAEALEFAHTNGIIHRDVKPENILISHGHALVADFGIAKAFKDANALQLTRGGVALGTPAYMSPEQARGDELGPASDIYSLGCVLYEMVTGSPPYAGQPRDVMRQHSSARMPPIRSRGKPVPGSVATAVRRAMSKNPDDRYASAGEFAAALRDAVDRLSRERTLGLGVGARITAVAAAVLIVGTLLWRLTGDTPRRTIVIAPFVNQTGKPELDSVGGLAARALIARLPAGYDGSYVAATPENGPTEGASGGAGTLVGGSYYLQDDSLRFLIQVTDLPSGAILGSLDPLTAGREDYRTVVASLAAGVSSILLRRIGPGDRAP